MPRSPLRRCRRPDRRPARSTLAARPSGRPSLVADAGQRGADRHGLPLGRRGSPAARRRTGWGSRSRPCRWTPRRAGRRTRPARRRGLEPAPDRALGDASRRAWASSPRATRRPVRRRGRDRATTSTGRPPTRRPARPGADRVGRPDAGQRRADRHGVAGRRRGPASSTPSYGLGISESTLSVDTSNSGSSNATGSPTSLSQRLERALGDALAELRHGDVVDVVGHRFASPTDFASVFRRG